MTIAIDNLSTTETLTHNTLTTVRGGTLTIPQPSPVDGCLPRFPGFPSGFPFITCFPDPCPRQDDGDPKFYPI